MTDEQKSNKEQFQNCCEGMDFAELCGCGCIEMMKKMMPESSWPQNQEKETTE